MKVLPVIIAGGFGKRLSPMSTTERPKQFICFFDKNKYSCFQKTIQRIRTIFVIEQIAICCNLIHVEIIKQQLADINENNYILLVENDARNTFASTLFCLKFAQKIHIDTLFVSPADSFIKNDESFAKKIFNAVMFSFTRNKHILFGVKPTKACDRYGYIKIVNNAEKINNNCYYKIKLFKEKPSIDIAKSFVQSGDYFWNSGHFIFDVNTLSQDIKKYQKSAFANFKKLKLIAKDKNFYTTNSYFDNLPILPVDKAIVEKSHNFLLNKLSLEWHDIGSFEVLEILIKAGKISIPKECYLVARRDSNFLKLISNL